MSSFLLNDRKYMFVELMDSSKVINGHRTATSFLHLITDTNNDHNNNNNYNDNPLLGWFSTDRSEYELVGQLYGFMEDIHTKYEEIVELVNFGETVIDRVKYYVVIVKYLEVVVAPIPSSRRLQFIQDVLSISLIFDELGYELDMNSVLFGLDGNQYVLLTPFPLYLKGRRILSSSSLHNISFLKLYIAQETILGDDIHTILSLIESEYRNNYDGLVSNITLMSDISSYMKQSLTINGAFFKRQFREGEEVFVVPYSTLPDIILVFISLVSDEYTRTGEHLDDRELTKFYNIIYSLSTDVKETVVKGFKEKMLNTNDFIVMDDINNFLKGRIGNMIRNKEYDKE